MKTKPPISEHALLVDDDDDDDELAEVASTFKRRGPMVAVLIANLVLGAVALGVPAYRGRLQARASQADFERFVGCLFDGAPQGRGGLALPAGSDLRFAGKLLTAGPGWLEGCRRTLSRVPPEEAIFVFPAIKRAGADVRAVSDLLSDELEALGAEREGDPEAAIPRRPLLAVEKLRAAMALLMEAAGTDDSLNADAIAWTAGAPAEAPARLPLGGHQDGSLALWGTPTGVEAVAVDRLGLSWLSLDDGHIDRRRARRTGLVRGVLQAGDEPHVVWATPEYKCAERDDRCARTATGVAPFDRGADVLPDPTWLAAHPIGRIDRSMGIDEGATLILARPGPDEPPALKRFTAPAVRLDDAPPVPGEALLVGPPAGPVEDALLLSTRPPAILVSQRGQDGTLTTSLVDEVGTRTLPEVAGPGAWAARSRPCPGGGYGLAYGTEQRLRVAHVPAEGEPVVGQGAPVTLAGVLDQDTPALDRVRVLCSERAVHVIVVDAGRTLWRTACDRGGACGEPIRVADQVHHLDAILHGGTPVMAVAGQRAHNPIRVLTPTADQPVMPAPCWDPRQGMCGQPTLVSDGTRLLVSARDLGDLLLMESPDGGTTWHTMSGVQVGLPVVSDPSAPMDQHLIRKGLKTAY